MTDFTVEETLMAMGCFTCGIVFAIPADYQAHRKGDYKIFYCPNGHQLSYDEDREEEIDLKERVIVLTDENDELKVDKIRLMSELDQLGAKAERLEDALFAGDLEVKNKSQIEPAQSTQDAEILDENAN